MDLQGNTTLNVSFQSLKKLPEIKSSVKILICNNNQIEEIEELPPNIIYIDCSFNPLKNLKFLKSSNVKTLIMQGVKKINIDYIPRALKVLDCSFCKIHELPDLSNLEVLVCKGNKIKNLKLNYTLKGLDATKNLLENIDKLPDSLTVLNLSDNRLKNIPNLGSNLFSLSLQNNKFTVDNLPEIPITFGFLNCTSGIFKNVPNMNKHTLIKYSTGDEIPLGKHIDILDIIFKDDRIVNRKVELKCIDFITTEEYNILDFLEYNSNNFIIENNGNLFCYRRNEIEKHINTFNDFGYVNQVSNYITGQKCYKLYMREYISHEDYILLTQRCFSVYKLEKSSRVVKLNNNTENIYKVTPYTLKQYIDSLNT
jgi:hypothetical protein